MKVCYMDGVGPFGGASRSLYEAVRAMPIDAIQPYFIAANGTALNFYREVAADVVPVRGLSRFDNTRYSHYRGKRWLILARETAYLPSTLAGIRAARKAWGDVDLIHVNEVLELLPAILAKKTFGAPLVVHVRSVQNDDPRSRRYRYVCDMLRRHADQVIAIDENVRASLPADINVAVIHNSFTAQKADVRDDVMVERLDALRPTALKVGFVGNLHHSKGLFEMIEAAKLVIDAGHDVEFAIVGGTTISDTDTAGGLLKRAGLAQNVQQELRQRAAAMGLQDRFHLLGPTADIQSVYDRIDVICFASHYDAPGRPVFEAAFAGVPSITAVTHPHSDTIVPDGTGICIQPRNVPQLAEAIIRFAENREEVRRMGSNALALAKRNFDPAQNALKLLAVYRDVVAKHRTATAA